MNKFQKEVLLRDKKKAVLLTIRGELDEFGNLAECMTAEGTKENLEEIRTLLESIPHLTPEDIEDLNKEIDDAIAKIPEIERTVKVANKTAIERRKEAFEAAKAVYESQSTFKKLCNMLRGRTPANLEARKGFLTNPEVREFYGKTSTKTKKEKDERG